MSKPSQYRPTADGRVWRPGRMNDRLPDLDGSVAPVPGNQRCRAIGLPFGDCEFRRLRSQDGQLMSFYCHYHDAVQREVIEPELPRVYPAYPLPKKGYVIEEEAAA